MGSQTMASQGGGGGSGPHRTDSHIQNLARQGSLYSLTLNEVQTQLGEPLLSMNLDELLKSIFPEGTAESESPPRPVMATGLRRGPSTGFGSCLPRQGSITMPPTLSKKTVDEVWRGISGQEDNKTGDDQLGEMTLESFLIKAGVVLDEYGKDVNTGNFTGSGSTVTVAQTQPRGMQWFGSAPGSYMPGRMLPVVNIGGMGPGTVIDAMYPGGGRWEDMETPGRKRTGGAVSGYASASGEVGVDKTVERRQKRMIKNRESAARSRARKQAYTNELENKVSLLEDDNERLKKQKVLDKILCAGPPPAPKYQLRRTSSAPF